METAELHQYFTKYPKITTDTRKVEQNSLFFALKGEKFNGNAFAEQALKQGAAFAVIDEEVFKKDERYLLVDDVLLALQDLARYHRKTLTIPVIGITGTNGKTTTKELLHAVLKQRYKTFATHGNLNNHIGVPLSLLGIRPEIEMAIIEMGANHPKEIAFLCQIAQPTHGLITNVGKAHLEGFGGFEGVKKTKAELYVFLAENEGTLFLQGDNPILGEMIAGRTFKEIKTYGFTSINDISGKVLKASPFLSLSWTEKGKTVKVDTQLTGSYNAENVLAAVCVARYFDVGHLEINGGLAVYAPKNSRSQILKTKNNTVICDYYNANASSMHAALDNLNEFSTGLPKVIILGDMFELGEEAFVEHQQVLREALSLHPKNCIFVGEAFYGQRVPGSAQFYRSTQEAVEALQLHPIRDTLILLKASRGMAFEKILDVL